MRLVADLHVHSRYSRATSREADLAGYHRWARVKGIDVVGTGDFTHPRWFAELSSSLVEKDGLYALKDPPRDSPLEGATPADRAVRFLLTTEISSIYKKHGTVRKVHSLIGVPTLDDARRLSVKLAGIGNIASDGRPILGLDPKDLLSLLLETSTTMPSSSPRTSGRHGSRSSAPNQDSIGSRTASRSSPHRSSRWRRASPPTLP